MCLRPENPRYRRVSVSWLLCRKREDNLLICPYKCCFTFRLKSRKAFKKEVFNRQLWRSVTPRCQAAGQSTRRRRERETKRDRFGWTREKGIGRDCGRIKKSTAILKIGNAMGLISSTISGSSRCANSLHLYGDDPASEHRTASIDNGNDVNEPVFIPPSLHVSTDGGSIFSLACCVASPSQVHTHSHTHTHTHSFKSAAFLLCQPGRPGFNPNPGLKTLPHEGSSLTPTWNVSAGGVAYRGKWGCG